MWLLWICSFSMVHYHTKHFLPLSLSHALKHSKTLKTQNSTVIYKSIVAESRRMLYQRSPVVKEIVATQKL